MGILSRLGITTGSDSKGEEIFESLFPSFFEVEYSRPSEYITLYWNKYLEKYPKRSNNLNGAIFEYILSTLCIRENLLPLYRSSKVAFVPNVIYDIMFYSAEVGPICWSVKTSLRERYKQADLEAIALKYVHRKALAYLITLNEHEAKSVQDKIKSGDIIGLDKVVVATSTEFDDMIKDIKEFQFSEPPTVKVISSSHIVTKSKVEEEKM